MDDADSKLWELEKQFWLGGVDVYQERLADHALRVFPGMVLTKPQVVASLGAQSRWTSVSVTDQRLVRLVPDAVGLIYRASSLRDGHEAAYSALVSNVYVEHEGNWRLTLRQQSPAGTSA